jgi:hypothetical protein
MFVSLGNFQIRISSEKDLVAFDRGPTTNLIQIIHRDNYQLFPQIDKKILGRNIFKILDK